VPLLFCDPTDHDVINAGDKLCIKGLRDALSTREPIDVINLTMARCFQVRHSRSDRQVRVVLAGGLINDYRIREQ
jgi:aconitate hydratase